MCTSKHAMYRNLDGSKKNCAQVVTMVHIMPSCKGIWKENQDQMGRCMEDGCMNDIGHDHEGLREELFNQRKFNAGRNEMGNPPRS